MKDKATTFNFVTAFSRNLGWVTQEELQILRTKRVAIAGLGGAGGHHLVTLARLGVGKFNLAEFDSFELHNFNRQEGALISNLGKSKLDVMVEMALNINPDLEIRRFPDGVNEGNVEDFLDGADLYADGLDFFAFKPRIDVFKTCEKKNIPAVTAAPLGMSVCLLNFLPEKMSFTRYFGLDGLSEPQQAVRLIAGLAPKRMHMKYLVDSSRVDFFAKQGPSTPMACDLCAGMVGTQALKILLKRGHVMAAPWGLQFDAYSGRLAKSWVPFGSRNPLQRLKIFLGERFFLHQLKKQSQQ